MAMQRSQAMTERKKTVPPPKRWKKKIWAMQPWQEIVLVSWRKSTNIFGEVTVEQQRSMRARFRSRKYMGVWSWQSKVTVTMIRRFPTMVVTQTNRNRRNRNFWSSWVCENPKRTLIPVWCSVVPQDLPPHAYRETIETNKQKRKFSHFPWTVRSELMKVIVECQSKMQLRKALHREDAPYVFNGSTDLFP